MLKKYLFVLTSLVCVTLFHAPVAAHHLKINDGYIRETIPGTQVSSAYFKIMNLGSSPVSLIKVSAAFSPRVELHQHTMVNGLMKMGQVAKIPVEAQSSTVLQPSGLHVMIFDLSRPLVANESELLLLEFDDGSQFTVELPVVSLNGQNKQQHQHH